MTFGSQLNQYQCETHSCIIKSIKSSKDWQFQLD